MDYCVCCGAELPTECGKQYCKNCELAEQHTFMNFTCPSCGNKLELYYQQLLDHIPPAQPGDWPFTRFGLMYHCKNCGCDWSSEYNHIYGDVSQSALKRHYWG